MTDSKDQPVGPQPSEEDGRRVGRRGFFTQGFRELLKPIVETFEEKLSEVQQASSGAASHGTADTSDPTGLHYQPSVEVPEDRNTLLPPGALDPQEFYDRCLSSGQCVAACPVEAIKLRRADDERLNDKPFIDAESQACVVCEDLACMSACPSGALQRLEREDIRMGTAELEVDLCLRTQGEDCQICVDKCPLGTVAIEIPYEGGMVHVKEAGCTGCGVCQMVCPTDPRAIVVIPPGGERPATHRDLPFGEHPNGGDVEPGDD